MEVYIEYALMENFATDYLLLSLASTMARVQGKRFPLVLSSVLGAILAVVFPLWDMPKAIAVSVKCIVPFLLCLLPCLESMKGKNRQKAVGRYLFFVFCTGICTCLYAGVLLAVSGVLEGVVYQKDGWLFSKIPFAITLCCLILFCIAVKKFCKHFFRLKRTQERLVKCAVTIRGYKVQTTAFLDSGNMAQKSGKPVFFCSPKLYATMVVEGELSNAERLQIRTVLGDKTISVYPIDGIEIYFARETHTVKGAYLAPTHRAFEDGYDLIVGDWIKGELL